MLIRITSGRLQDIKWYRNEKLESFLFLMEHRVSVKRLGLR